MTDTTGKLAQACRIYHNIMVAFEKAEGRKAAHERAMREVIATHDSAQGVGDGWKDPTGFSAAMVSDEAENWTPRETGKQMLRNYAAMLAAEVARHDT